MGPSQPSAPDAPIDKIDRQVWLIASVVVLGAIGSILATTSPNVAFETLAEELHAGLDMVQWVSTGYLLGLAAVIATTGWLSKRFGARRLYLITLGLFAATSVLCSLATTIEQLIVFRILQGVAGGATMPVGMMMLAVAAGPQAMGRVMSVIGVPMILGPILGPVLGGLLISELSWHWIFLMNVPLAFAALALGFKLLPPMPTRPAGPFDLRGWALIALGAPTLVFGLAQAGSNGSITAPIAIGPSLVGLALIVLFAAHAWRAAHPLLDVRLWQNRGFAACACTAVLVSASLFGTMLTLPLFFQLLRGQDALHTGLMLMPQGIGTAISMGIAGRLTDRLGGGRVALTGITILIVSTIPLVFVDAATPYWLIAVILLVRGLGTGASIMPATAAAYATLQRENIPDATPQLNMIQRVGGSVGTAILAVVLHIQLERLGGIEGAGAVPPERSGEVAAAFSVTFVWAAVMTAIALVPASVLLVVEARRRKAAARPAMMLEGDLDPATPAVRPASVVRVR